MSFSENTSDSDWKETKMKVIKAIKDEEPQNNFTTSQGKIKYSQKFCDKWLMVFNKWLARYPDDPNKPFCRACQCVLDCNKCHLQRHERTRKHKRNLDILLSKGENAARQNLSIRQERSKYYLQRKKTVQSRTTTTQEPVVYEEVLHSADEVHEEPAVETVLEDVNVPHKDYRLIEKQTCEEPAQLNQLNESSKDEHVKPRAKQKSSSTQQQQQQQPKLRSNKLNRNSSATVKKEGIKLLMQIHKDKNDLMDSFKELITAGGHFNNSNQSPPREKNHVDLFFESVSSSVKAFSPKLIAEAKMRVSQLICELELRGLTDETTTTTSATSVPSTVIATSGICGQSYIINPQSGQLSHIENQQHHQQQTLS